MAIEGIQDIIVRTQLCGSGRTKAGIYRLNQEHIGHDFQIPSFLLTYTSLKAETNLITPIAHINVKIHNNKITEKTRGVFISAISGIVLSYNYVF